MHVWLPTSQLHRSLEPGVWYLFYRSERIAIVRMGRGEGRKLLRSVIFLDDPARRQLADYFPGGRREGGDGVHLVGVPQTHRAVGEEPEVRRLSVGRAFAGSLRPGISGGADRFFELGGDDEPG